MNKCPKCGALNKPIAAECEKCGEPLKKQKVDFDADQAKLDAAIKIPPAAPSAPKPPAASKKPGA